MICKICESEFDPDNFEICPYCLSPFKIEEAEEMLENNSEEVKDETNISKEMESAARNINNCELPELEATCSSSKDYDKDVKDYEIYIEPHLIILNSIEELDTRSKNVLSSNGLNTMDDLYGFLKNHSISDLKNAGKTTVENVMRVVESYRNNRFNIQKESGLNSDSSDISFPFRRIHYTNEKLPMTALKSLGISSRVISLFYEDGIKLMPDLKSIPEYRFEQLAGKTNLKKIQKAAEMLELDLISLLEKLFTDTYKEKQGTIFLRRAKGETLQEIADNPEFEEIAATREGIRQNEKKYYKLIYVFVKEIYLNLMDGKNYLRAKDILEIYDNDDFDYMMLYAAKVMDEFEYLDFADTFVLKTEGCSEEKRLLEFAEDFIGDGIDLYENLEDFEELLRVNRFEYLELGEFINLLQKNRYYFYGDFVVRGKQSYGLLCTNIVRKYFPDGIKLSQNNNESGEDLTRLRELVRKEYGDLNIPANDRALSTRLASFMVLCDRGKVIPVENIVADESVLSDIKKYIDDSNSEKIFYSELFAEFEGLLLMTGNINNYNFLHGVLMLYYPEEYKYSRDYLLKGESTAGDSSGTIGDRIYSFIRETGRAVHKNELRRKFLGLSDVMIFTAIANDRRIMQWEYNFYSSIVLIQYDDSDYSMLKEILMRVLNENAGYSSDSMYYEEVKQKHYEFLVKNNIKSDMNLYYTASCLFENICDFRRPHIVLKGKFESFSTQNIAMHLMKYPRVLSYSDYCIVSEKMKWSPVTSGMVFGNIEQDYYRISQEEYIIKEDFNISENDIIKIQTIILNNLSNYILPVIAFDCFEELPELKYEWNEFLLTTVIENFCSEIDVIYPNVRDRRYQKGIAVEQSRGFKSYDEIIAYVMESNGIKSMSESQFLSFLTIHGLTRKVIPKELMTSKHVFYENEQYMVRQLF